LIAHPTNQTAAGFYVNSEPYLLIENHSPACIGGAVRSALAAFKTGIPAPLRRESPSQPVSSLQKQIASHQGARLVSIEQKEEFTFVPHLNGGGKGANRGYHEIVGKKIFAPASADDTALGDACLRALALCE